MSLNNLPEVIIYTDGSCHPSNPGPGGYAAILLDNQGNEINRICGGCIHSTNNRMELMSAIKGIELLNEPHNILVYTDSEYLANGVMKWLDGWIRNNWIRGKNKPVINQDLWEELHKLRSIHQIEVKWVKGHAQNQWNILCDKLAFNAASNAQSIAA